jgi:Tol biopolymer transport system component
MRHPHSAPRSDVSPSLVRAELERILGSDLFSRSDRLSAFLRYIVEATLSDHGDSLKEHVIAVELYGKSADFDTAADPIVRVDARRLRDKLREYYATAPSGGIVISVPKGSYLPVFEPHAVTRGPLAAAPRASRWLPTAIALVLIGGMVWLVTARLTHRSAPAWRQLTVTSFPGSEEDPYVSPDGNFVVFSWPGPVPNINTDIWVKAVEGDALRQLTSTPDASEKYPVWSPDGRHIAFNRIVNGASNVYMVSALGGPERQIAERGGDVSWLPDGQSLVMSSRASNGRSALVHHRLETGGRRQLTEAPAGFSDFRPRVSPDGRTLAFQRHGDGRSALFVKTMAGGQPTLLGDWYRGPLGGLSWTPDGREILFGRPEMSGRRMVRVPAGGGEPVAVAAAPLGSVNPSMSLPRADGTFRLALSGGVVDVGLRMVDLQAPRQGATIAAAEPFCDATRMDVPGRFSPDGAHVAFVSDRSGTQQVWVAGRDGSGLRSVTTFTDSTINVASWSPDNEFVIVDANVAGNTDIYAVPVNGGTVRRMTQGPSAETDAEWSRDGRWIYYASNESGATAIWKMPAGGGAPVRLTSEVGFEPHESPDGRTLYFVDARRTYGLGPVATLKQIPVDGGTSSVVEARVMPGAWAVTDTGIVFVAGRPNQDVSHQPDVLAVYDFAERRVHQLGVLPFRVTPAGASRFLTVSRDGRWAVASHVDKWDRDVLVIDNFR